MFGKRKRQPGDRDNHLDEVWAPEICPAGDEDLFVCECQDVKISGDMKGRDLPRQG